MAARRPKTSRNQKRWAMYENIETLGMVLQATGALRGIEKRTASGIGNTIGRNVPWKSRGKARTSEC